MHRLSRIRTRKFHHRHGMAVVMVLGLLSITLALSYAMLRTQVTSVQIQTNHNMQSDAKQAAMAGLTFGMRQMQLDTWAGVDTTLTGSFGSGKSYLVEYTTGDPQLLPGDDEYDMYPYRVTITSTGTAINPTNPNAPATATMQAVVQLVPRALSSEPAAWNVVQHYTMIAWKEAPATYEIPVRVEGRVRMHGELELCEDYPPTSRPWCGTIDEVAIFPHPLSESELQDIYDAGIAGDGSLVNKYLANSPQHYWRLDESEGFATAVDSVGGAHGTFEAGVEVAASGGPFGGTGYAARFDGHNDHINVGNLDVYTGTITLAAWIQADEFTHSDARIISKADGTPTNNHHWMLSTTSVGGSQRLRMRIRTLGSTSTLVASSGNLQPDTWYFVAATFNGWRMKLYLNGEEVGSQFKFGPLSTDMQVPVYIGDNPPGCTQTRYLRDLEAMRVAGVGDWRPFDGPVELPYASTSATTLALLQDDLNVATIDISPVISDDLGHPGTVTSYQLYPGGKVYQVSTINSWQLTENLEPDNETNPLGIYLRAGRLDIGDGVSIEGTIITTGGSSGDVDIRGDNVQLKATNLPALHGSSEPIQLPAAIVYDDVKIGDHQNISIEGFVVNYDDFTFEAGDQNASCDFQGRLLTGEFRAHGRDQWSAVSSSTWESWLTQFVNNLSDASPITYFPQWLSSQQSLAAEPKLKIRPPASNVKYHWHDFSQPVFVPHSDDGGLRWDVVRWSMP